MIVHYISLEYEDYKALEDQCQKFEETSHTSVEGFYHKSFRLRLSGAIIEFLGPRVPAGERR